jgi:hypothetical protein
MFYCFKLALPSGPLLIPSTFPCFVCLLNCTVYTESTGAFGNTSSSEGFWGLPGSLHSANQAKEMKKIFIFQHKQIWAWDAPGFSHLSSLNVWSSYYREFWEDLICTHMVASSHARLLRCMMVLHVTNEDPEVPRAKVTRLQSHSY